MARSEMVPKWELTSALQSKDTAERELSNMTLKHSKLLNAIMDVLDVREAYSNKTYKVTGPEYDYTLRVMVQKEFTKTDYGKDRFEKDILAAADSVRGKQAMKRIRKAMEK